MRSSACRLLAPFALAFLATPSALAEQQEPSLIIAPIQVADSSSSGSGLPPSPKVGEFENPSKDLGKIKEELEKDIKKAEDDFTNSPEGEKTKEDLDKSEKEKDKKKGIRERKG